MTDRSPEVQPPGPPLALATNQSRRACGATTTRDNRPCRGIPTGDGFCPMHSPAKAELMAQARSQGGARTAVIVKAAAQFGLDLGDHVDVATPDGLRAVLALTMKAVAAGRISSAASDSIGRLVRAALDVAELEVSIRLQQMQAALDALLKERDR
jgi:hypothetical protein